MDRRIVIAVDAMGGDSAPESPVEGSLLLLQERTDVQVMLVGREPDIHIVLSKLNTARRYERVKDRITIIHADEAVSMKEDPKSAARRRKTSMFICCQLVRDQKCDAMVSAGNTGALILMSRLLLKMIPGVLKPALLVTFPTLTGPCVSLDLGANAENTAEELGQFGVLGSIFARTILGITQPRVGLMCNGTEDGKGTAVMQEAHKLLKSHHEGGRILYVGYVEGSDLFPGKCDVIVFDGATGNIVLKLAESFLPTLSQALRRKLRSSSIFRRFYGVLSYFLLKPTVSSIKHEFDYQRYGGSLIVGVNGVAIKAHGKSTPLAIQYAIEYGCRAVTGDMVGLIKEEISHVNEE